MTETAQLLAEILAMPSPRIMNRLYRVLRNPSPTLLQCPAGPVHGSAGCYGEPVNPSLSIHRRSENIEFRSHHMRLRVSGDSK
tara:strand:+ start:303 stop:551 length:249 start_codon:yes stop_codon:yes gene_type:complete